jgi:hypothetical protein
MVLPVRQGLRQRRSAAGTSKSPPLPMRGLATRGTGSAFTVGRADVRAPADLCWRRLVTHAVLTVRCANMRKFIAEKKRRAAESRGGHVPPRLRRRHAASAALSGPPHLLRDELLRTAEQPVPPRWLGTPSVSLPNCGKPSLGPARSQPRCGGTTRRRRCVFSAGSQSLSDPHSR